MAVPGGLLAEASSRSDCRKGPPARLLPSNAAMFTDERFQSKRGFCYRLLVLRAKREGQKVVFKRLHADAMFALAEENITQGFPESRKLRCARAERRIGQRKVEEFQGALQRSFLLGFVAGCLPMDDPRHFAPDVSKLLCEGKFHPGSGG